MIRVGALFNIGQKVVALKDMGDNPSCDSPGGLYASAGDILYVRAIHEDSMYPIAVSHEGVLDRSFGVQVDEVEAVLL